MKRNKPLPFLDDDLVFDLRILDRRGAPVFKLRKAKMETLRDVVKKYFGD